MGNDVDEVGNTGHSNVGMRGGYTTDVGVGVGVGRQSYDYIQWVVLLILRDMVVGYMPNAKYHMQSSPVHIPLVYSLDVENPWWAVWVLLARLG